MSYWHITPQSPLSEEEKQERAQRKAKKERQEIIHQERAHRRQSFVVLFVIACAVWACSYAAYRTDYAQGKTIIQALREVQTLSIVVPGKTIELSSNGWTKMKDTEEYAKNFEERTKAPWHEFGRVVTVYVDRVSTGVLDAHKIAEDTYVDFFIVHPGFVTVHTWVSKGTYYVLCRETFKPKASTPINILANKGSLGKSKNLKLWRHYQSEVDATRNLLNTTF